MGNRNIGGKEAKKPKKGSQKAPSYGDYSEPAPEVEIIKKKRKNDDF